MKITEGLQSCSSLMDRCTSPLIQLRSFMWERKQSASGGAACVFNRPASDGARLDDTRVLGLVICVFFVFVWAVWSGLLSHSPWCMSCISAVGAHTRSAAYRLNTLWPFFIQSETYLPCLNSTFKTNSCRTFPRLVI